MTSKLLLFILVSAMIAALPKPIRQVRSLRSERVKDIVTPRKLKIKTLKRPMDEVRENKDEQEIMFRNLLSKIKSEKQHINDFHELAFNFMPAVDSLYDGIVNQITELGASVQAVLQKAPI